MHGTMRKCLLLAVAGIVLHSCASRPELLTGREAEPAPTLRQTLSACRPYGLAFDGKGRIWVSFLEGIVVRMDDLTGGGLRQFGFPGNEQQQFGKAMEIACDENGRVYVIDPKKQRLVSFDAETGKEWKFLDFSQGPHMTMGLCGIAIDPQGRLVLVDQAKMKIFRFDTIESGNPAVFGEPGRGIGQFMVPHNAYIDPAGELLILDLVNHRIVKMNEFDGSGWQVFEYQKGLDTDRLQEPYTIAKDSKGRILIADSYGGKIVRIDDMNGAGWVAFSPGGVMDETEFFPVGIKGDPEGRILFIDQAGGRIVRMDDMKGSGWIEFKF